MPILKFVATALLMGAQMAMTALRKIEGPRLEDLKVTVGDPGAPLNYFFGTRRFAGMPIFYAEDIREKKRRRKTKGGKYNEYTYYGTFAAVIADHLIDGVTRIWLDKHLVYDATGAGPITPVGKSDDSVLSYLRIYLGSDAQDADPRMLAKIEALHGTGSCPAYRRIAYIMFEELPLEKFGNRIPQISVEAVSNGSASYPYDSAVTTGSSGRAYAISSSGAWLAYFSSAGAIEWWDLPSRTRLGTSAGGGILSGTVDMLGLADDGTAYYMAPRISAGVKYNFYTVSPLDVAVRGPDLSIINFELLTRAFGSGAGTRVYTGRTLPGYFDHGGYVEAAGCARDFFEDQDGDVWGIFQPDGASSEFSLINITGGGEYTFTATARGDISTCHGCATGYNTYFVTMEGNWYAINQDSMTITSSGAAAWGSADLLPFNRPGSVSFWSNLTEYSLQDGSVLRTHPAGWAHGHAAHTWAYDPANHAIIIRPQFVAVLVWEYLDRITGDGVTLASITAAICERCGIEAPDYSVTALASDIVEGYSYTQGQGHAILEPLLDLYGAFPRPHNFIMEFKKRGGATAGTIDVTEFASEGSGPRYTVKPLLDTDLPRVISLIHADPAADQQPNVQVARRPLVAVDGVGENSYDMVTWVSEADTARNLVETYMRGLWNRNETIENSLTAKRLALEPGDTWNLALDGNTRTATVTKMTVSASDVLKLEWEKDFAQLATLPDLTSQPRDGHAPSVLIVPIMSKALVLDMPLIRDSDNDTNPILYEGAAPLAEGFWPGAVIYQHDGDDYNIEFASVASTFDATWGQSTTTLPVASYFVWDRGNTVTVTLNNGTLAAATEAECNANPRLNMFALGGPGRWEIGQFTTPTLVSGKTYTLSGLKRGRRGTEWAIGLHTSSDMFVLLDVLAPVEMGAGDIGDTLLFKAATSGLEVDSALETAIAPYAAQSHKPWAPAQFRATKDSGTGDWAFTWRRRSRVAGDYAPHDPALGESAENYEVYIYRSGFGSPATRTITATSETATYTAAQQVTDGGAIAVGDLDAGVLQVGDLVDGFETQVAF